MLLTNVSSNQVFIISEYWILIPLIAAIEIAIVVKVRQKRAKKNFNSSR